MDSKLSCFVVRPFSEDFSNVWELGIKPAAESAGMQVSDAGESAMGNDVIHRDISKLIWGARIVVVELTSRNPNVMYELGLAHAAKKDVIMLLEEGDTAPFDVAHIRYLRYSKHKLVGLRDELSRRLKLMLSSKREQEDVPDFFPQLTPVTQALKLELTYLRRSCRSIQVSVNPKCADIFFNDKLIGSGEADILINVSADRNTVSVCALGFFEYHSELEKSSIDSGLLSVILEPVRNGGGDGSIARQQSQVPRWLRYRRRDPHNPVLMRAISNYLLMINERNEALEEVTELLATAPDWYLSQNQMGFYHGIVGDTTLARPWYERALAMAPNHYIGNYNLSCISALEGRLDDSIWFLEKIAENADSTNSLRETIHSLSLDPDFDALISNPLWRQRFRSIELRLLPASPDPHLTVSERIDGYLF
jgi:hypothetical protein